MASAEFCRKGHVVASDDPRCEECEIIKAFQAQRSYREADFEAFKAGWIAAKSQ